jgi:hypothetical protein
MQIKPGIHKWRDIYFSIEYDHESHYFRGYFVHNNRSRTSESEELNAAREMCAKVAGLSVNHSPVPDTPGMMYWEYQNTDTNIDLLMTYIRKSIDTIRNWEAGVLSVESL